ncbi:DUF2523 domain-containing protein [Stenotrophomonas sp. GD03777]|uniref:DUF2523 family protein n=1 Tax=Stenotrophomonas sp. GD03777 TaxID=2975380 RepID=UPI00244A5394|nr:DUF2523 family protein [Stenotrophomonas sp. GD03777]MDH1659868.1 DUF2523 domain-containing protein [Stenotrophomonas sp. GD03777]
MGMVWDWITNGVSHLLGKTRDVAAGLAGKALATFGLTTVTFNALLPKLKEFVMQFIGGIDGPAWQMLSYLGVGIAFSMIFSALTVRMAWKIFIVPKAVADQLGGGS